MMRTIFVYPVTPSSRYGIVARRVGAPSVTSAVQRSTKPQTRPLDRGTSNAAKATAGAIAQSPEAYYGKRVTVRAEVEDVLGRQAFLLDEDRLFAWTDLLVIAPALTGYAPEGETVTVTGVKPFVEAEFGRGYQWSLGHDLDTKLMVAFKAPR